MIIPDSNLLLYAYNSASHLQPAAAAWWEACLSGTETVGLVHPVVFSFLRISTMHARICQPHDPAGIQGPRIMAWVSRRVVRVLTPGHGHVHQVMSLLEQAGSAGGNLVTICKSPPWQLLTTPRCILRTTILSAFPG